ncbi:MAG: hypothetical protein JO048_07985 [Methylobacteriaceae bacterium]|nr:hypothetical protein [Methylobacteriaceae bacterium]
MAERLRQLVLDLPVDPRYGAEDFLIGPSNAAAHALVTAWPAWPSSLLHLEGPSGSGKSHLAAIWAERTGARTVPASAVGAETVPTLLASPGLVLEDIDRGPLDESALFHLVNLGRERALPILFTSAAPIEGCGILTADLRSRLRLAPSVRIGPPDDALMRAVLVKLFMDRQLAVEAGVVEYVAARIGRSIAEARAVVAAIDEEALSRGRRVTRLIAAAILRGIEPELDADEL